MMVFVRKIYVIFLLSLLLGCGGSEDFIATDAPSPVEVPPPSSTPNNIAIIYDELPKINILSGTNLIASPAFPKSQLANTIVKPGESVYLVGSDKDNAWLLVLYMNTLGWIPSIFSITGTGALEPTVVETPRLDNCAIYLGSVIIPNGTWESNSNTRVLVQGFIYSQIEQENSGVIALAFQIEETGRGYSAQINHIALESGNEVLLFTAVIDKIQSGNHIKYNLSGLRQEITPFQAAFFSDDCSNPFANVQTIQPPQLEHTPTPPISTLIVRITSSVMPPSSTLASSDFANYSCPDKSKVKLRVGLRAVVSRDDVNLRSSPKVPNDWDANIIAIMRQGDKMTVIDGPKCSHDGTWWEVETDRGYTGWIREFLPTRVLIEPIK